MPQSNAERKRKYIAKLKETGGYEEFLKRKAEQQKEQRNRLKDSLLRMTDAKRDQFLCEARMKSRKRVEKHRKIKKENKSHAKGIMGDYRTASALRKAATKVRKSFPLAPGKRVAVLNYVLHGLDQEEQKAIFCQRMETKTSNGKSISPDVVQAVEKFYQKDDISRMSPNVKDVRLILNKLTGKKETTQIRHLMYNVSEVYELFLKDFAKNSGKEQQEPPLKVSKFCALRPKQVKLLGNMPHDLCTCIYHQNFIECCSTLSKNVAGFPDYGDELMRLLLCEISSKQCSFKTCSICTMESVEKKLISMVQHTKKPNVTWYQWTKNEDENRVQKLPQKGPIKKLLMHFIGLISQFLKHSFVKRSQAESFNIDREAVNSPDNLLECVVQFDFSENHTCEAQDEVQGAHWNQKQVSLFTAAIHYAGSLLPKVVPSDSHDHSKMTIFAYLHKVFQSIPKKAKIVKLWSDGPSSQFKNKFMAAALPFFEKKFKFKIIWNYFATAHGKGCIDGFGAVAKHRVRRMVLSRKAIVNCAKDFVTAFNMEESSIDVTELTEAAIKSFNKRIDLDKLINDAPAIPDISSYHQLQMINDKICGFVTSFEGYQQ